MRLRFDVAQEDLQQAFAWVSGTASEAWVCLHPTSLPPFFKLPFIVLQQQRRRRRRQLMLQVSPSKMQRQTRC